MEVIDVIIIFFILLLLSGVGSGVYYFFFYKQKGEECEPEKDGEEFGKYEYDENKECVLSNCMTGYIMSGGKCFKQSDESGYGSGFGSGSENKRCELKKIDTSPCSKADNTTWSGITLNEGQMADKYEITKKEVGTGVCEIHNKLNIYELPKSGKFYYHIKKCPHNNCDWKRKSDDSIQYACFVKYPNKCIPLGSTGTIENEYGYTNREKNCSRDPARISCKDYGYKYCPASNPASASSGCGPNTQWYVVPKTSNIPNHNDYINEPAVSYCKSGSKWNLGKILHPIVNVQIKRCNNGKEEIMYVPSRWFLDSKDSERYGFLSKCYDVGLTQNCGYYPDCKQKYPLLWKDGTDFDDFLPK